MTPDPSLRTVLIDAASDAARDAITAAVAPDELDAIVARWRDRAAAAWPGIAVAPARFVAHVGARLAVEPGDDVAAALAAVRAEDLYLAAACADGDDAAIDAFCRRYLSLGPALAATGLGADAAREVEQHLAALLFVGDGDRPPHVVTYQGRGDLKGWVKAIAARVARRRRDDGRRFVDADLVGLAAAGDDPRLAHLKALYRHEFAAAFEAAIGSLEPRERTLLRQHHLDGLTIDDLGVLHRVHRATVARWIAATRQRLERRTRAELARRLRVGSDDLDSILRMIESQLVVSLRRHLA